MSKVIVRQIQSAPASSIGKCHAWAVYVDEKEVARFPGRAAARECARRLREEGVPVFEEKERNPFIEGPAPESKP